MNKFKAILVDVEAKEVRAIDVADSVDEYNKAIGSDVYCGGPRLDNGDGFLVDDEGMLKVNTDSVFFTFEGYPQPLAGNGLLLGCGPDGDTLDAKSSVDEIARRVKFLTLAEVQAGVAAGRWS